MYSFNPFTGTLDDLGNNLSLSDIDRLTSISSVPGQVIQFTSDGFSGALTTGGLGVVYVQPGSAGFFRVHGGFGPGGTTPGTIHLGTEVNQGWSDSYIDVNDVNQTGAVTSRLMQFWWTNTANASASGIGMSMKLSSINAGTQCLNPNINYSGQGGTVRMNRLDVTLSPGVTAISDFFLWDVATLSVGGILVPAITRLTGYNVRTIASNKVTGLCGYTMGRQTFGTPPTIFTLTYMPTWSIGTTNKASHICGEQIVMAQDKEVTFNGPTMATTNYDTLTLPVSASSWRWVSASSILRAKISGTDTLDLAAASLSPTTTGLLALGTNALGYSAAWFKDTGSAQQNGIQFTSTGITAARLLTIDLKDGSPVLKWNTNAANVTVDDWFDQSVKVAATPQFTRLGLGVAADGTAILKLADPGNIILGTVTGTKIGTATTQLLGFFNATPVAQQNGTGETVGFTAGTGTTVHDDSTFTGNVGATAYRISDVVKALKKLGLLAS